MPSLIFIVINLPEEKKTQKNHPGDCGLRLWIEQDGWIAKVLESQCSVLTEHCCSRCGLETSWKITHANYLGSSQPTESETLAVGLNYLLWHKLSIELWCLLNSESLIQTSVSCVCLCSRWSDQKGGPVNQTVYVWLLHMCPRVPIAVRKTMIQK